MLEAELAASESRFRVIVEQSPVMIWRSDRVGRCDFFNESWLDFRGRPFDQETGQGWAEGIHPDDSARRLETFRRAMENLAPFEMVYPASSATMVGSAGSPTRLRPIMMGRATSWAFSGRPSTSRRGSTLEAKLEQQSQHKSRLMAALSHDARTPLNAVVLSARLPRNAGQGPG